jgi:hypothetical protein
MASYAVESGQDVGLPNLFDFNWDNQAWNKGGAGISTYGFQPDSGGVLAGGFTNILDPNAEWRSDPYGIYYQFKNPDGSMKYFVNNKKINDQYGLSGQTNLDPAGDGFLNAPGVRYGQGQFYDADPMNGYRSPYKVVSSNVNKLWDTIDKVGLPVGMAALGGLAALQSGVFSGAGSAAAGAAGETGLGTLPAAGTWANTATPALGAAAGEWTAPAALEGIAGSAVPAAGGPSLWDTVSNTITKLGTTAIENFNKNPIGFLGKIISGAWDNKQARDMEKETKQRGEDLVDRADPFGPQRAKYQELLRQSYDDPAGLFNSPEYQGMANLFTEQINRRDAAKGRTEAGVLPRTMELQDNFMKWLGNYREGLQKAAGTGMDPTGMGATAMSEASKAMNTSYNSYGSIPNAIAGLFDPYQNEKDSWTKTVSDIVKNIFA